MLKWGERIVLMAWRQKAGRLIPRFKCWNRRTCRRHHLKFINNFYSSSDIQSKWPELRLDIYIAFLRNLIFCNDIQVCERLVHERGHVRCFLKYLCILVVVDESEQLIKYFLDVWNFLKIACNYRHFCHKALFFASKFLFKLRFQLHFFLLQLSEKISETFVNVFELLKFQPGKFIPCLIE